MGPDDHDSLASVSKPGLHSIITMSDNTPPSPNQAHPDHDYDPIPYTESSLVTKLTDSMTSTSSTSIAARRASSTDLLSLAPIRDSTSQRSSSIVSLPSLSCLTRSTETGSEPSGTKETSKATRPLQSANDDHTIYESHGEIRGNVAQSGDCGENDDEEGRERGDGSGIGGNGG
ncbi:hypothetical protein BGW38_008394, partial [Lunasporangiospora selenospora]